MSIFSDKFDHPHQWFGGRAFSQSGEGFAVVNIFHRLKIHQPSFLDIGAHHPFELSNTALIYKRGGRGVNVEANPDLIKLFDTHRPEDKNVWSAVLAPHSIGSYPYVPFYRLNETSGINSTVRDNLKGHGKPKDIIQVPAKTINYIVTKYCNDKWPDFLSLDTEGRDFEILESIPEEGWARGPKVICVEAVTPAQDYTTALRHLMHEHGYYVHSWCGHNMICVRIELKPYLH